jgi:hypothetical protein
LSCCTAGSSAVSATPRRSARLRIAVSAGVEDSARRGHVRGTRPGRHQSTRTTSSRQDDPRTPQSRLSRRTRTGSFEQSGMIAGDFRPCLAKGSALDIPSQPASCAKADERPRPSGGISGTRSPGRARRKDIILCLRYGVAREPAFGVVPLRRLVSRGPWREPAGRGVILELGPSHPPESGNLLLSLITLDHLTKP